MVASDPPFGIHFPAREPAGAGALARMGSAQADFFQLHIFRLNHLDHGGPGVGGHDPAHMASRHGSEAGLCLVFHPALF